MSANLNIDPLWLRREKLRASLKQFEYEVLLALNKYRPPKENVDFHPRMQLVAEIGQAILAFKARSVAPLPMGRPRKTALASAGQNTPKTTP